MIVVPDMQEGYLRAVDMVLQRGARVAPRGRPTMEVLGFQLVLTDPRRCLATGTGRKLHPGVAAAEALQLVGGFSDPGAMLQVSPHFAKFLDGGVLHAPYGPRVLPHLPAVVQRLMSDPYTRQAVIAVWDPVQDLHVQGSRDYPCTTHLQLMCRDDADGELRLDCHVSMRANDAWHGFPYDVFQFAMLQLTIARVLGVEPGRYFHHATSFHLYDEQLALAAELALDPQHTATVFDGVSPREPQPATYIGGAVAQRNLTRAVEAARGLFYGTESPANPGERYLWSALRAREVTGAW